MMMASEQQCRLVLLWILLSSLGCRSFFLTTHRQKQLQSSRIPHWFPSNRAIQHLGKLSAASSSSSSSSSSEDPTAASDELNIALAVPMEWQGAVLQQLKSVIDPDLGSDIVTLGFVQNLKLQQQQDEVEQEDDASNIKRRSRTVVSFNVELTTPACPVKEQFRTDCERLVLQLPFVDEVKVTMTAQAPTNSNQQDVLTSGMAQVGAVIAVSSCKGGVGKSTTAVNLAFSLQALGATVGILDADVYGPSLPTMVVPDDDIVRFVGRQIAPLQRNGVRLMSFGYVNEGSAVMRGPMVTQLLDQFMSVTNWGACDYLILDMPPGTGDIPLTLTQRLNITAAVIVTTPQELSFADVVRGVEMFDSVNVPSVAVVENMAYYEVPAQSEDGIDRSSLRRSILEKLKTSEALSEKLTNGGSSSSSSSSTTTINQLADELVETVAQTLASQPPQQIRIFGPGHTQRLSEQWGIEHTFSMPLLAGIAANGDSGTPFVLQHPDSAQTRIYMDLARAVVSEVAKAKYSEKNQRPVVTFEKERNVIQIKSGGSGSKNDGNDVQETISAADLRRGCRCAACVEELTGRQLLKKSDISESIQPLKMGPTGNYALSVDWSDGHRSLYPYRQIRSLIQEQQSKKEKESSSSREKAMV